MIRTTFIVSILFSCFFLGSQAYAQQQHVYDSLVTQAFGLYEMKDYKSSAEKYTEAFVALGGKGSAGDRYNAACSWALAGNPDSAFVQLFEIVLKSGYSNLEHITSDTDLTTLHKDKRWKKVIREVRSNKEKEEANFDKPLVAKLNKIYEEDQSHRVHVNDINKKYGWESPQMDSLWKIISLKDSLNLIEVKKILDTRGWLGADIVGTKGNSTLFLVIQHADQKTQERYLPMMREAVAKGNAAASSLALLEDRVALGQGKKQIYGSQIGMFRDTKENFVLPLEDPDNVDQRRESVGLGKFTDYLNYWGITWDVEEYKLNLPRYEEEQKKYHQD